jgi:phosphoesterase RecJ-like protein
MSPLATTSPGPDELRAADFVRTHRTFLLTSHDPLDGDSIGCEIALALGLEKIGKRAFILNDARIPENYLFLPGIERVKVFDPAATRSLESPVDAAITVDCGCPEKLERVFALLAPRTPMLNIDHHAGSGSHGDVNWVETGAASAGLLVLRLLDRLEIPLDRDMATNLHTTLVHDTGRFSFSNTTPDTLRIAARLVETGVDVDLVNRKIFREKSLPLLRIEGLVAAGIELIRGGRVAVSLCSLEMCARAGIEQHGARDLIEIPAGLPGVEVALLFREIETDRITKVSLRSTDAFDSNEFVAQFGGGGHKKAAGCTIEAGLAAAERRVVTALLSALDAAERRT